MPKTEYLISELAERAGVTPRTIRFYTDEGLLPPPEVRGKYACYSNEHLDRLELIRRLKDRFLPLREIRQTVTALSPQDVTSLLAMQDELAIPSPQPPAQPLQVRELDSAQEYITNLMKKTRLRERDFKVEPSRDRRISPAELPALAEPSPHPESRWTRFEIAPGVEMHVEESLVASLREKVRKVVEFARGVFRK